MASEPLTALAHGITLGLGGLTQLSYKIFEALGVDMATIEEALAGWTQYAQDLKARADASDAHAADIADQLQTALDTIQQLQDTDAAEDAQQAADLTAQIAQQIQDALTAAQNPPAPVEPPPSVEEPPVEEPPVDSGGDTPPAETPPTGDTGFNPPPFPDQEPVEPEVNPL